MPPRRRSARLRRRRLGQGQGQQTVLQRGADLRLVDPVREQELAEVGSAPSLPMSQALAVGFNIVRRSLDRQQVRRADHAQRILAHAGQRQVDLPNVSWLSTMSTCGRSRGGVCPVAFTGVSLI